jgi:hypothetical protein
VGDLQIKSVDWLLYNWERVNKEIELVLCGGHIGSPPMAGLGGLGTSSSYVQSEVETDVVLVERCRDIVRVIIDMLADESFSDLFSVYFRFYELEETYQEMRAAFISSGYLRGMSIRTLVNVVNEIRNRALKRLEEAQVTSLDMMHLMEEFGGKTRGKPRDGK